MACVIVRHKQNRNIKILLPYKNVSFKICIITFVYADFYFSIKRSNFKMMKLQGNAKPISMNKKISGCNFCFFSEEVVKYVKDYYLLHPFLTLHTHTH